MVSDQYLDTDSIVADPLLERLRMATAGTYDIAGVLGRGGMAVVFVGEDMRLRRTVAIKVMEPHLGALPGMAERFLEEARTLAHLQHQNIIVVHDVQQAKGLSFFVMALIEGGGVDQLCRREEPFPIDQARWILLQASSALAYAHSERIIHRDVKPANILVNVKGNAVLTDFGIAKVSDGGGLTKSGTQIGTPVYMSPEQFSEMPIGPASDQYALGITAYEMLTGRPPFTGELYTIIAAHGVKAPVPIRQLRPDCPAYLANAVMRMLEKRPQDRWPSLDDLREVFGANMPSDGGAARRQLAELAREMYRERKESVKALTAEPPQSPVPTNAARLSAPIRPASHIVTVWPPGATIFVGGTLDLRASVTTETGDPMADANVTWSSSHPECVDVDGNGRLRGVSHGSAVIRATVEGVAAESHITSDLAPVARLAVTQREMTILVGDIVQPSVSAIDVTGATRTDVSLTWISRGPTVAHLDAPGTVRALNPGLAVIEVSFGNVRQSIEVTVVRRPVTRLKIRPVKQHVELGASVPLIVDAFDDRGGAVKAVPLRWRSSAPSVIHVDSGGIALAIGQGTARIVAEIDEIRDTVDLIAIESPIASLNFAMTTAELEVGDEAPVQLIVTDANGDRRSADGVRAWSGAPDILALDTTRMIVTALASGTATLQAASVGADGGVGPSTAASVIVREPAIVRIITEQARIELESGAMVSLASRAVDRRGRTVPTAEIVWESLDPDVVTIAGGGLLCAVASGDGEVVARASNPGRGSVETRVAVHVQTPVVQAPVVQTPVVQAPVVQAPVVQAPVMTPPVVQAPVTLAPVVQATPAPSPPPVAPDEPAPPPLAEIAWKGTQNRAELPTPDSATIPLNGAVLDRARAGDAVVAMPVTPATTTRSQKPTLAIAGGVLVVALGGWLALRGGSPVMTSDATIGAGAPSAVTADSASKPVPQRAPDTSAAVATIQPEREPAEPPVVASRRDAAPTTKAPARPRTEKPAVTLPSAKVATKVIVDAPVSVPQRQAAATPGTTTTATRVSPVTAQPQTVTPTSQPRSADPDLKPAADRGLDLPSAADLRAEAERVVSRVRSGAERPPELSGFFNDGDDHKVALANAPSTLSESASQGRSRAQFLMRLSKRDSFGIAITRVATVTMDVVKRDGSTSVSAVTIGSLSKP